MATVVPNPIATNPLPPTLVDDRKRFWSEGNQKFAEKKYADAFAIYARGLMQAPHDAPLWFALGAAAAGDRRPREAKAAYLKALYLQPKFPEALLSLGNELYHDGNFLGAAMTYLRAIAQRPRYAKAHCNLGNALSGLRRYDEAVRCYEYALKFEPKMTAARHNLGNALLKRHEYTRAEECFRAALRIDAENPQFHNSLGNALLKLEKFHEAEASYRHAVDLSPEYSAAHTNLANALLDLQRYAEMETEYRSALELDEKSAGGQYNLALACLRLGKYLEGWQRYEWRWQFHDINMHRRKFAQPQFTREQLLAGELAGKTILLHAEQGMGDTLQFVRYLPLVAAQCGRVVLEVQPRLKDLFLADKNLKALGAAVVVARGEKLSTFDFHCPLMSLPAVFATTVESVPAAIPYLHAPAEKVRTAWAKYPRQHEWRTDTRLRVGLVWEGNLNSKSNLRRSTTLQSLLPLLQVRGAQFFSLQVGPGAAQLAASSAEITDACSGDSSFADAAAVIATLDLVITVDTSIAHLAGALGLPVWTLLPYRGDWRWMDGTEKTPWYPTMRLYRQPAPEDWATLVDEVRADLQKVCALVSQG